MKITFKRNRFYLHLWMGLSFLTLKLFSDLINEPETFFPARFINNICLTWYVTMLHFILLEYTLPYFRLSWKRILLGLLLIWIHMLLYSFGLYTWRSLWIALHVYTPLINYGSRSEAYSNLMGYSMMSLLFFAIVRHIYLYIKLQQATKQLRIEKQEAELNYLKSQTNPHFLFNTLNNIYSLARDKSDLAPESILRLSKILRFMLYETGGEYIAIEHELKIMDDYIALERLRYDESLHVNFNYDIEDMKQALPPLLLIPLVENAFKHGVSETRGNPFIDIHLSVKQRQLAFTVKNSAEISAEAGVRENIGLSNLRRQLELLYTDYNLSVQQNESVFTADLKINLASHV